MANEYPLILAAEFRFAWRGACSFSSALGGGKASLEGTSDLMDILFGAPVSSAAASFSGVDSSSLSPDRRERAGDFSAGAAVVGAGARSASA